MRLIVISMSVLCCLVFALDQAGSSNKYTEMGADFEGNSTGEIGPFEGAQGLECPADIKPGGFPPNPYRDEKPLYRIDSTNIDQYEHHLSPGQIARLKKHPYLYLNIYQTHRNNQFFDEFYQATTKSKESSHLDENNILQGYQGGIPFPFPKNGLQAIWNVKRPYYGDDVLGMNCRRIVSPTGRIKKSMWTTEVIDYDERRLLSKIPNPDSLSQKILTFYTYPADEAGTAYLGVAFQDDNRLDDNWIYIPSLRRVRRAPTLAGGAQLDGESTMDEMGWEFRGPVNDWYWKLLGKKEMYIPVNCYDMWEIGAADQEECLRGGINPARLRYELRRVWVVEGTPKEGLNHPYSKRVGYYDEDTWQPAAADRYDKRGNLWRMMEFYTTYDYCQHVRGLPGSIYLNLETGRYEVFGGCRDKETFTSIYNTGLDEGLFTVQALRKHGR